MTDPVERMDPWEEALSCYKDFADEVIIVGENGLVNLVSVILAKLFKRVLINHLVIG